jgi:hypothetical protein
MPAYSGLFDGTTDVNGDGATGHTLQGANALKRQISRITRRTGFRKMQELMLTLNGAAAGSSASKTHARVGHTVDPGNATVNGGVRTIETVTDVSRVTTSADKTEIDGFINETFAPATYPADVSGNGGGGRLANKGIS